MKSLLALSLFAISSPLFAEKEEVKTYERQFNGVIGRTYDDSVPSWPKPLIAKEGTPNILIIVLDDVGFSQIGSFGGLINTPNIDRIAENGLRFNNFHTTALCSPTRSCILTGRNHHSNGMGAIAELSTGFPGYNAQIPFQNGFLSEILLEEGYATFAVGKWHLTPDEEMNMAARKDRWPLGRGFERFYGFLGGDAHQYYPTLTYDNHFIDPPKRPEDGYHFTDDITDKSIEFISDLKSVAPNKPFFLYYATGAMHAPHHVRKEWIEKYQGKFDMGWDQAREMILEKQKKLGIIPQNTELAPRNKEVSAWEDLNHQEKELFAYMMEIYAGMFEHTDSEIGRLLEHLENLGQLDNTVIILVSDNGASPEGEALGLLSEGTFFNKEKETFEYIWKNRELLGGVNSYNHYPQGWTMAGNTPFKRWKREVYLGGIRDPLIVSWPDRIKEKGGIRPQYVHAIDIVPTLLDVLEIQNPDRIKGYAQSPIEGVSFKESFSDEKAPSQRKTQYFEMFGTRALYHEGWTAISPHYPYGSPVTEETLANSKWELYNTDEDFSQTKDLSADYPEKVQAMLERWWSEAGKYQVLPLDGRLQERLITPRPQLTPYREQFVYYPGTAMIKTSVAAPTLNNSYRIIADLEIPEQGAEGVIMAQGSNLGGWSLYIHEGKLTYLYNYLGQEETKIISDSDVPTGIVEVGYEFIRKGDQEFGSGGVGTLTINGTVVGKKNIDKTIGYQYWPHAEGLTTGYDNLLPVSYDYQSPATFTGKINQVTVDILNR